ncbi:unnamed protein product [Polarella glacialis]|uniref:Uncharacterized protein n=1 Tax=Polarella glacialis TaxID=89957 RepID=A0A813DG43_POLGL|nr:unnamed protein product [Polarella glacialis]
MALKRSGSTEGPKLQSRQNAAAEEAAAQAASHRNVDHNPKEAFANTAQRACGRCLVKGDVVYTAMVTGAGYVAMCNFSSELCNTMGIHLGIKGAVAESKNASEHNAASAVLSVLGVECGPKKSKVPTMAPIQSPRGLQGPPSGAKTAMPKLQSQQNAAAEEAAAQAASHRNVDHNPKEAVANTAQRVCGRCLVKGDVVYTAMDTGAGYIAMCNFSSELCNTMGIHLGIKGAVAESQNASEHNAASAVLSVLGVECGPKKSKVSTKAPIQSPRGLQGPPSGAKTAMPKLQSQQNAAAEEAVAQAASHRNVDHNPKEAFANTAQRAYGRCLVKGDVVYTAMDTGAGYVAMCNFSSELCNTMGIHQGIIGAVAESRNAAEHNAASAVLSVLGVECGPKKSKVSTKAPIQSSPGLQGPPSGAKTAMPKLQSQQNSAAAVDHNPKDTVANTAQRACGRCLVKGDVVYTAMVTGAGYVAMCNFSSELCNTMGIHQGIMGAVAESKNAAEHNAASALLSVLGVECGPKKSKVSTESPIQSTRGWQGPSSSAKKTTAPKAKMAPCRVFALFKPNYRHGDYEHGSIEGQL